MNCNECDKPANWLVIDLSGSDKYLLLLCEEHFQEVKEMEGEMNLDFEYLEKNFTVWQVEQIIEKVNRHNQTWEKRYQNLMAEYSAAKKLLGLKPGQKPSDLQTIAKKDTNNGESK
jgi:hypothetical protein